METVLKNTLVSKKMSMLKLSKIQLYKADRCILGTLPMITFFLIMKFVIADRYVVADWFAQHHLFACS